MRKMIGNSTKREATSKEMRICLRKWRRTARKKRRIARKENKMLLSRRSRGIIFDVYLICV